MPKKFLIITPVFIFIVVVLILNHYIGFLYPHIPFYNYYGVNPPNDSWQTCKGTVTYMNGTERITDDKKKFQYWAVRALKENNPSLCKNVGVYEGGDVLYTNEHAHAVEVCQYIFKNNKPYVSQCGEVY